MKKKFLIGGVVGLIIIFIVFDCFIIKFIRENKNEVVEANNDKVSEVANKGLDINVEVSDDKMNGSEEMQEDTKEEIKQEDAVEDSNPSEEEQSETIVQPNDTAQNENNEINITKTQTKDEQVTSNNKKQESQTSNNNSNNNNSTTKTTINTDNANKQQESKTDNNQPTNTQTNTQENNNQTQVKEETQQQPVQEVVPEPVKKVEYKRNNEYIQKIENYIRTHETDDMKKNGYSINVDESIVNYTNPFTFSDYNMKTCIDITYNYHIYARDYYYNGKYVETQCFVQ